MYVGLSVWKDNNSVMGNNFALLLRYLLGVNYVMSSNG